jgi:restriction system protein
MWLTLRALRELGGEASRREVTQRALKLGRFSHRQLSVPSPHAQFESKVHHRFAWTFSQLKAVGAVKNPTRGIWVLTDKGREMDRQDLSEPKIGPRNPDAP